MTDTTGPELMRPLRRALPRLQRATGLDGALAGLVTRDAQRVAVTELHDMLTDALRGFVVVRGKGVGGAALQRAQPVSVDDYPHATTISRLPDRVIVHERVHGLLAVPVPVGREVRALLYGVARTPQPLGDRVLDAAARVAAAVARELTVECEVVRRLRLLEDARRRAEPPGVDLRAIREELLSVAAATQDEALRDRLSALCDRLEPPAGRPTAVPLLTGREQQVLAEVALGRTTGEIADQLAVKPTTVKTYLKNIMRKLGTRNRVETVTAAQRAGLLG